MKNIENWRSWKMRFFWVGNFEFFFEKKCFLLHLNENKQPVHMRYHLFLQYGWFLQNLGKDFIRTNMHTTVIIWRKVFRQHLDDFLFWNVIWFQKLSCKNVCLWFQNLSFKNICQWLCSFSTQYGFSQNVKTYEFLFA